MSGIDPLAALAASAVAAADAAITEATLSLGVPTEILRGRFDVGDVITAKVLPPQKGQDFIEISGQPVAAQLPPDVRPGETLALQVKEFTATQVLVRNLGPVPPAPESPPAASAPPASTQDAPMPHREVFVAASLRRPAPAPPQQAPVRQIEARIVATQAARVPHAPAPPPVQVSARMQPAMQAAAASVQRVVRTTSDLLRAVRLPDTPFTRTVAAIAPQAAARLPAVLQRLETALAHASDPRIATLRTIAAFTAKLDPANAESLPAQISAYVAHVIEGAEPKLVQLLQARASAAPASPEPQTTQVQAQAPAAHAHPAAQAHAVQREAAVQHDLKSLVLSVLRNPPETRPPALMQALNETLVTLTGTQVNVLASNAQDPGTIVLPLPAYFYEGGKPAQLRISRDAANKANALSADDFHVAFVLDTANLGTVAIDVQSTGRSVKIDVKTQKESAAARFTQTLDSLRGRLEQLRYRVTGAAAKAHVDRAQPPVKPAKAAGLDFQV